MNTDYVPFKIPVDFITLEKIDIVISLKVFTNLKRIGNFINVLSFEILILQLRIVYLDFSND